MCRMGRRVLTEEDTKTGRGFINRQVNLGLEESRPIQLKCLGYVTSS